MLTGLPHPGPLPNRCGGLQHAEEEAVNERLQDGEKPPFLRCARRSHSCDIRDFSVPPFPDLGDWQRPIRGGEVRRITRAGGESPGLVEGRVHDEGGLKRTY